MKLVQPLQMIFLGILVVILIIACGVSSIQLHKAHNEIYEIKQEAIEKQIALIDENGNFKFREDVSKLIINAYAVAEQCQKKEALAIGIASRLLKITEQSVKIIETNKQERQ